MQEDTRSYSSHLAVLCTQDLSQINLAKVHSQVFSELTFEIPATTFSHAMFHLNTLEVFFFLISVNFAQHEVNRFEVSNFIECCMTLTLSKGFPSPSALGNYQPIFCPCRIVYSKILPINHII